MITPYAALAAFLLLCSDQRCIECAKPFALLTAFSLFFYMEHHFMFAVFITFDAMIALYISRLRSFQANALMCLCLCSIIANIYGFSLYYNYMNMDDYNLIMQFIIMLQVILIWMLRDGLDSLLIVFRAHRRNSN